MNFGETIKKLRKQKDMTQEQLAEYLNISTQAVSRWETNTSLPDITLIPALANIFDVTSDVLLGIDITAKEKRIQEILDEANKHKSSGHHEKSAVILREALKEYPNSHKIMVNLMPDLWRLSNEAKTDEERKELKEEIIKFGEKILAECTNDDDRHSAIQMLCYNYSDIGEIEKAVELAKKMPSSCISHESLLQSIYKGDKRFTQFQSNIFSKFDSALWEMKCNNAPLDDGSFPYTKEELILIYKKVIAILEIIFEDKNYGFCTQAMSWTYTDIATFYAQIGDYNNAIENLSFAVEYSIKNENYDPEKEYTCLLFRGKKFGGVMHNITSNDSMRQLEHMQNPAFDPIRQNAEFIEIEERLKKHARKR